VPDFTSALYLGLRHAARTLRPWAQLTTGVPAALETPPEARVIGRRLAALIGCEAGLLAPSTLHLFFDLPTLASARDTVLLAGGGSLRFHAIEGPHLIVIASLAKGFGVPLAVLAGARSEVERFAARSATQMHSSPPSIAALRAAERALALNRSEGAARRARLARLVLLFRAELAEAGIPVSGGIFPVQALPAMPARHAVAAQTELARRGVRAVAQRLTRGRGRLCFLLN